MILQDYQKAIGEGIQKNIGRLGPPSPLRNACEYALMNGGKRMRPVICLMIAKELGYGADVTPAALAIEYFHTASLVADDLPCMDDDDQRRAKPSVHKVYGEAAALLVSYALIAAGYACYAQNASLIKEGSLPFASYSDRICTVVLENATYNTGLWGATGGQFLDLNPSDLSLPILRDILHKKTGSLFEIAFVSGWLFGGGAFEALETVKKAARHFGMAFQIADDLDDLEKDRQGGRSVNIAAVCGVDTAQQMLLQERHDYASTLRLLNLSSLDPLIA